MNMVNTSISGEKNKLLSAFEVSIVNGSGNDPLIRYWKDEINKNRTKHNKSNKTK